MFENYKKAILLALERMRDEGILPAGLVSPSPARLRDECLRVYEERPSPDDDDFLRSFFGPMPADRNFSQSISGIDIDKFRPFIKFLKNNGEQIAYQTSNRNIELLAWLINFQARPYSQWLIHGTIAIGGMPPTEIDPPIEPKPPVIPVKKGFFIACILVLITSISFLTLYSNKTYKVYASGSVQEKCMYWVRDHYEPIACDVENIRVPVVKLDLLRLNNMRKINLPDTLTRADLGRTWYHKIGFDKVEFYTDSGMHPIDTIRRLNPLTPYMLNKYTSNPRHQLTMLIWSIGIIALATLIGVLLNRSLPRKLFVQ